MLLRVRVVGVFEALSLCRLWLCLYDQAGRVLATAPHTDHDNHEANQSSGSPGSMGHKQGINEAGTRQLAKGAKKEHKAISGDGLYRRTDGGVSRAYIIGADSRTKNRIIRKANQEAATQPKRVIPEEVDVVIGSSIKQQGGVLWMKR